MGMKPLRVVFGIVHAVGTGFEVYRSLRRAACAAGCVLVVALTLCGTSKHAAAQGKVVTISEVTIVGRVQKPIAAVDVSRIQPKLTLAELRQPFLQRITEAIYRAPF